MTVVFEIIAYLIGKVMKFDWKSNERTMIVEMIMVGLVWSYLLMYDNLQNKAINLSLLITIMSMCHDDKIGR